MGRDDNTTTLQMIREAPLKDRNFLTQQYLRGALDLKDGSKKVT